MADWKWMGPRYALALTAAAWALATTPACSGGAGPSSEDRAALLLSDYAARAEAPDDPWLGARRSELQAALAPEEERLLASLERGTDPALLRELGSLYTLGEAFTRGEYYLVRSLEESEGDGQAWYWLALNRHLLGRQEEARVLYERALEAGFEGLDAERLGGLIAYEEGELERAVEAFERALALHPDDEQSLYGLTDALESLGRLEEARAHLQHLHALKPEHPTPLFRLVRVARAAGHEEEALEYERLHRRVAILDDLRLVGPGIEAWRKHDAVGRALVARGLHREAAGEFRSAAETAADMDALVAARADEIRALEACGDAQGADAVRSILKRLAPGHPLLGASEGATDG